MKKNNISCIEKIVWYNIDEKGYIKGSLNNKAAIYIYTKTCGELSSYVGSSIKLVDRLSAHRYSVIRSGKDISKKKGSPLFYSSVLEYGWNKFKFGVLEHVDTSDIEDTNKIKNILLEKEQYYLNNINPSLNLCKTAGSPLGLKRDLQFGINVSKAKKGKKQIRVDIKNNIPCKTTTPETRLSLSSRAVGIRVKVFNSSNNLLKVFSSMANAAKHLGVTAGTISRILKTGKSYDNLIYKFEVKTGHPLLLTNKENNTVKEYFSIRTLAKDIGVSRETISNNLNTNKLVKGVFFINRIKD